MTWSVLVARIFLLVGLDKASVTIVAYLLPLVTVH